MTMTLSIRDLGKSVEINTSAFPDASFSAASLVETAQPVEPPIPQKQPEQPEIPAPVQPITEPAPDPAPIEPPAPAAPQPADPMQSPPRM